MSVHKESLGRWISILYRCGQINMAHRLEPYGVGRGKHRFLTELFFHNGLSQGEIAHNLSMDKGTVARALMKLEKAGYVKRRRDDIDGRVVRAYLTDKAESIKEPLFSVLSNWTLTLADGLTDAERRQGLRLLQRMTNNANRALTELREKPIPDSDIEAP